MAERTGLLLDPYFSATKAAWLLDKTEGARARAKAGELAFGTVDSFLIARLTGGAHLTDATNASRTSLFDIRANQWDDDLLALFDVPRNILPDVLDCAADFGVTRPEFFGREIPVFGVAGDQQAAAIGQACFEPGSLKSTYGTGCFLILQTGKDLVASENRLLGTISRRIDGECFYALEGSIFIAGAAVQWLRDALGVIGSSDEVEKVATSIDDNDGVYFVPALSGLGAPHWDADARGLICGLTRGAGRAHIVRAALEAAAYQTSDILGAFKADGVACDILKVDGGMARNDWLMQFLADVTDAPVERPRVMETTALGAAFLAGVRAGVYDGWASLSQLRKVDRRFAPTMPEDSRTRLLDGWRQALQRTLG